MRLAVTADLHWGLSGRGDSATRNLADRVAALSPDAFAIAGDIGEGERFSPCLRLFEELTCDRLFVPGNHDLWGRGGPAHSLDRYERLPEIAGEHGFQMLDVEPYVEPGEAEAVLGSINWYDYSFADPELEEQFSNAQTMYENKLFPRGSHNDGRYVDLDMSDQEFTRGLVSHFTRQLRELPDTVKTVTVIQHHPPVRELFYPTPLSTVIQRFWLAYTGNRGMAAAVVSDPRIRAILCGHTHAHCEAAVDGRRCINIGGDYDWKRLLLLDTESGAEEWWDFRL